MKFLQISTLLLALTSAQQLMGDEEDENNLYADSNLEDTDLPFNNNVDIINYEESDEQPWLMDYNVQHSPVEAGGVGSGIVSHDNPMT